MAKQTTQNGLDHELIRDHIKDSGPVRDQVTVNKANIEATVGLLVKLNNQLDDFDNKISSIEMQFNEKLSDTNVVISQKIHDISEKLTAQMTGIYTKLTERISEKDGKAIIYNTVAIITSAFIVGAIAKFI